MPDLYATIEKAPRTYLIQLPRDLIDWWGHPCYITIGRSASLRIYSEAGWKEFSEFAEANRLFIRDFNTILDSCIRDYVGTDGVVSLLPDLYIKALSPEAQVALIRPMETYLEIIEGEKS